LDIQPEKLHQRTPVFMGSTEMVEKVEEFVQLPVEEALVEGY